MFFSPFFSTLCVVGCLWVLVDVVASVLCEDVVECLVDVSMDVWMSGGLPHLVTADGICLLLCHRHVLVSA